eukprot:SAG31_NODE_4_length_45662_cov_15.654622_18_plen_131_part_00
MGQAEFIAVPRNHFLVQLAGAHHLAVSKSSGGELPRIVGFTQLCHERFSVSRAEIFRVSDRDDSVVRQGLFLLPLLPECVGQLVPGLERSLIACAELRFEAANGSFVELECGGTCVVPNSKPGHQLPYDF